MLNFKLKITIKLKIMSTISKENYLKTIYSENFNTDKAVSVTTLSERLGVTKAAVSDMAKKLAELNYINYKPYKGISLSSKGKKIAMQIIRRHRLWELFLINVLDLSWSEVHDEAEKLEHCTSDILVNKIDDFLGNPKFDPHGDPIPNKKGVMPLLPKLIKLSDVSIGSKYKVARVNDRSKELMNYLTKLNIQLNTEIKIIDKLNYDNTIFVIIKNKTIPLSEKITGKIYVTVI